jgi:hypothetical protein
MSNLRPYHGLLLLLQSQEEVLASLPIDSSPSLVKLVKIISPLKNLQTLSLDSDISMTQVLDVEIIITKIISMMMMMMMMMIMMIPPPWSTWSRSSAR